MLSGIPEISKTVGAWFLELYRAAADLAVNKRHTFLEFR
jgi:hypothetical protein